MDMAQTGKDLLQPLIFRLTLNKPINHYEMSLKDISGRWLIKNAFCLKTGRRQISSLSIGKRCYSGQYITL